MPSLGHCNAYALELADGVEAGIVGAAGYHMAGAKGEGRLPIE